VNTLLNTYYKNTPDGLPGNDDTGTMSAWAVFSMMGIYPIAPATPTYTFCTPKFEKIIIHLDTTYYKNDTLTITSEKGDAKNLIEAIEIDNTLLDGFFMSHEQLLNAKKLHFILH